MARDLTFLWEEGQRTRRSTRTSRRSARPAAGRSSNGPGARARGPTTPITCRSSDSIRPATSTRCPTKLWPQLRPPPRRTACGRSWRTSLRRSRRTRQVLSPQEGLQVLHREDRRDSVPRCPSAARLCRRARQDCAPPPDRRLHQAPAPPDTRHQAGTEYRAAALCHAPLNHRCSASKDALTIGCPSAGPLDSSGLPSFWRRAILWMPNALEEKDHGSHFEGRCIQSGPPRRSG